MKILIIAPAWLGDIVMAQSLFKLLIARHDQLQIDIVAPPWGSSLLQRMPQITQIYPLETTHGKLNLGHRMALAKQLRGYGYQQAIILPRSFKAALIPWLAGIPRRTGFTGEWRYGLINDWRPTPSKLHPTAKSFASLGLAHAQESLPSVLPSPSLQFSECQIKHVLQKFSINPNAPTVALLPGAAYGPAKQWPIMHFTTLSRCLVERDVQILVLGADAERAIGAMLVANLGPKAINLCGKTSLPEVVDLLAFSKLAISNDSGLMHVAAAVGIFVIALYGSSSPQKTPPLTSRCRINYLKLECSPCFARECRFGHQKCLMDISPAKVYQQTLELLHSDCASEH